MIGPCRELWLLTPRRTYIYLYLVLKQSICSFVNSLQNNIDKDFVSNAVEKNVHLEKLQKELKFGEKAEAVLI